MYRELSKKLEKWNNLENSKRRPLIVRGARQVGKTYLIKEWGTKVFGDKFQYFDFRENKAIVQIFAESANLAQSLDMLEITTKKKVNRQNGLIFLDEIQDAPGALPSLKYFRKTFPNLRIIAAGSHLGMTKNEEPFPVGEVEFANMVPLSFAEFLQEANIKLYEYYDQLQLDKLNKPIPNTLHMQLLEYLRLYSFTGGMPAVVDAFLKSYEGNLIEACNEARHIQLDLVEGYKGDFTKYSGTVNSAHILDVFENIPSQLSRAFDEEVKKYKFSDTTCAKYRGFASIRGPLTWLTKARLVIKSRIANRAEIPIKAFTKDSQFKLYSFDVGILAAMLDIQYNDILSANLGTYKGYLVENFIAQEIFAQEGEDIYCWTEGRSELEFILVQPDGLIPVEAKSSLKSRRSKSLVAFLDRYPRTPYAFKITGQNVGIHPHKPVKTIPLYLAGKLGRKG